MLEMMLYFVGSIPHNSGVSKRVMSWCSAMSVSDVISYSLSGRVTAYEVSEDTSFRWSTGLLSVLNLTPIPPCSLCS